MTSSVPAALREVLRPGHPMLRAGYDLITSVVVTSLLGLGFWIAAARLASSSTVGRDTVLVSAMLTLSAMCQLNLGTVLLRFLPATRVAPGRFIVACYAATGLLSLLGGSAFVIAAPRVSNRFDFLHDSAWLAPAFVAAVVLWGVFTLQDSILTALRRSGWVPIENASFGVLKIVLLPGLLLAGVTHAVFLAWVVAMAVLIVPVSAVIRSAIAGGPPRTDVPSPLEDFGRRGLIRFGLHDLGATILAHASTTMLPVLIVVFVGSADSAYFFMPFTMIAAFDLLFLNVAAALTVEGAATRQRLAELVRITARRFAPLLLAGVAFLVASAPLLLGLYGGAYAESGATVLRLLACASVLRALTALYSGVCRVEGRGAPILALQGVTFALLVSLTVVLAPSHGIEGVAAAWLLTHGVVAAIAAPGLLRRSGAPAAPRPEGARACAPAA